MTTTQPLTCRNCGDLFTAPERPCPLPSPGREYKETGRGGHRFYPPPPPPPCPPVTKERLQEIGVLAVEALNEPTSRMACDEVKLLRRAAATVPELLVEIGRLRTECKRLRRATLETSRVFTPEQIERLMEVEP